MTRFSTLMLTTAVTWAFASPAAFADVSAQEVWGDWRDYMQGMGYEVTATETESAGQLAVSDIRVDMSMGKDKMAMSLGALKFIEQGDGTVDIVMPEVLPFTVEITPEGKPASTINMSYTQSGQALKVSGDPKNLTYDYHADSIAVALDEMVADGETLGPDNLRMNVSANNVESTTSMVLTDKRSYQQSLKANGLQYDIFAKDPDEGVNMSLNGQNDSLTFDGTSDIPLGITMTGGDMTAMMDAGFSVDGTMAFGAGAYKAEVADPSKPVKISGSSDSSALKVKMSNDGLAYSGEQTNLQVDAQVPDLPFPINLSMAKNGFNLMMPIKKSDEAQDFALAFNTTEFTMSDMIWAMFDPGEQLPRDPATIALDLTGKAKLLLDFLDPKAAAAMDESGEKPGELEAITINALTVDAVGLKLTGTGDFTFDNTDVVTVPGMPKPVGSVDLNLVGANALIDKLIAMGVLPQEQAMGARMMMGMLAVQGAEPDSLTSKIEMTEDGQILANGQRIK